MALRVKEQNIAVFGESGSGKTVLLSSFYGATQEPTFAGENLFHVVADNTSQGLRLLQNYLGLKKSKLPEATRFAASHYAFTLKLKGGSDPKASGSRAFDALRLVWHDYPGEWFEEEPSSAEEASRRVETFTKLLKSDVAVILVDGQMLIDHAGEEERYLKSLLRGFRGTLLRLKDDILTDGKPLAEFPRVWILALSKSDLHPDLDAHAFKELLVEKAAADITALREVLSDMAQHPEALSLGEDYLLLSSAKFEPGKIEVSERVGMDLVLPIATLLPLERLAQWADKFDLPLKWLDSLVDNAETFSALLSGAAGGVVSKALGKLPKVGPLLSRVALPGALLAADLGVAKLTELRAQAVANKDYVTATLASFQLALERGTEDRLIVKSPW